MSDVNIPDLRSHTVAWFRTAADVRAAETELELHGIESEFIEVARPSVEAYRGEIDRRTWSSLGMRGLLGLALGAAAGVLVGLLIGFLLGNRGSDLVAYALGGFIFGGPVGAFYMVGVRLPTQEQTFDTYGGDQEQPEWIAIGGPDEVQSHAAEVLQRQHPVRIDGHAA